MWTTACAQQSLTTLIRPCVESLLSRGDYALHVLAILPRLHSACRHRQLLVWWPALQVAAILPMLKRGIGIHHSGLLPILKEVIEIMFQEGLLKVGCLSAWPVTWYSGALHAAISRVKLLQVVP